MRNLLAPAGWAAALLVAGCGGGGGGAEGGGVGGTAAGSSASAPVIVTQPAATTAVGVGQPATFSVSASGSGTLTYQWRRDNSPLPGQTGATYVLAAAAKSDAGAQFDVVVSNASGSTTSHAAALFVDAPAAGADVTTWHNDAARTGQNLSEVTLTPALVSLPGAFGLRTFLPADGKVDAQPLYVSGVTILGIGQRNLLLVATEHGTVYAFDADDAGTASAQSPPKPLWTTSLIPAGETASGDLSGTDPSTWEIGPEIGITSTPVVDRTRGAAGVLYAVAMSKKTSLLSGTTYFQRLHALDLSTGAETLGGPVAITAQVPGYGDDSASGIASFVPQHYKERSALLLSGGVVYTSWASHDDQRPYGGWIIAYDGTTLARVGQLNITANGSQGAFWGAGAGPSADALGRIYALAANGTFDTTLDASGKPISGNYGNAFLKLTPAPQLAVADYFESIRPSVLALDDMDLGAGGSMLLPGIPTASGTPLQLAVGAGKDGSLYVVDTSNLGKYSAAANGNFQEIVHAFPGCTFAGVFAGAVFSSPAYYGGRVFYAGCGDALKAFPVSANGLGAPQAAPTPAAFDYPGATPAVSANGSSNGIVWAVQNGSAGCTLRAYDATSLKELYNNLTVASDGIPASDGKFIVPTVSAGKVFVGTDRGVAVFAPLG